MLIMNTGIQELFMRSINFNFIRNPRIQLLLKILISFILLYYLATKIDLSVLKTINVFIIIYLLISVLLTVECLLFMTIRWSILLTKVYQIKSRFIDLYRFYIIGMYFNIFFPGAIGGDLMRIYHSNIKYGLGAKKASVIVLAERVTGFVGVIIIFCIGSLVSAEFYTSLKYDKFWAFFFILAIIASIILLKTYLDKKIVMSYQFILIIIFVSIVGQFTDVIIAYLYCNYFNIPMSIFTLMIIMPIVYMSSVIPISLGGLGVREGTMAILFSLIGADPSVAVLISLLTYISKVIVGSFGGIVYIITDIGKPDSNMKISETIEN